jgi:hypothetical protein
MEGNARTWFTPKQKAELWERWKSGQCVADIARALERRNKSGVYRVLALNGGIAPAPRRREIPARLGRQGIAASASQRSGSGDHWSASFCATRHRSSAWRASRQGFGRNARSQARVSASLAR